jgi:hypothetical protein
MKVSIPAISAKKKILDFMVKYYKICKAYDGISDVGS